MQTVIFVTTVDVFETIFPTKGGTVQTEAGFEATLTSAPIGIKDNQCYKASTVRLFDR